MVCNSASVGRRQSCCPAKPDEFRFDRKSVNAAPSALVDVALHWYTLSTSCWSEAFSPLPMAVVFFSHTSCVRLSVIVPSPLSTNRAALSHDVPGYFAFSFDQEAAYFCSHV